MEETQLKPVKTKAQLDRAYTDLCILLGDKSHRIDILWSDIGAIKKDMDLLDKEAQELAKLPAPFSQSVESEAKDV